MATKSSRRGKQASPTAERRVRLKAANPFDLIRLIARSQSDPRKAVAELVQNSLDAGARQVRLTWARSKGDYVLSIQDDGDGVFAELEREEALRRIATTIGHSHKANLDPAQRHEQMTLGKYGIGLLGFWSVAKVMEIRSRVGDSALHVLRLEENRPDATIRRSRAQKLPFEGTFTEIVLRCVHPGILGQVKPRRMAAYLSQELRGQLLERDVTIEIHDRVARGRTQKRRLVQPVRFEGAPLEDVRELPVAGRRPARLDLYLLPEGDDRVGRVALACVGSVVLDDLSLLDGPDAPRSPWSSGRFEGIVDFSELAVAPSTRRGFVRDAAALDFLAALPALETRLGALLVEESEQRRRDEEADDVRQLRQLFRRLPRLLPDYALFGVDGRERPSGGAGESGAAPSGAALEGADGVAAGGVAEAIPGAAVELPDVEDEEPPTLFPPGPLASVQIRPRTSRLAPGGARELRAVARDVDGRAVLEGVAFDWTLTGPGDLEAKGARARFEAPPLLGESRVEVVATEADRRATAQARIVVTDVVEETGTAGGIPDPEPVEAPSEGWRSRLREGRWQYNSGHRDYRHVREDRKRRLQYLAHLFAKELVLSNFADPGHDAVLERMVQVLTYVSQGRARTRARRRG